MHSLNIRFKIDGNFLEPLLTICIAELLGGWGSMSNWEGVWPKFRIWFSMAYSKEKGKHSLKVSINRWNKIFHLIFYLIKYKTIILNNINKLLS